MKSTLCAAALATLPLSAFGATPFDPNIVPAHIRVANGQSIQQAIQEARFHDRISRSLAAHAAAATAPSADGKNTLPTLTGGAVISTTLTVGVADSIPEVQLGYKTGPSGLVGVDLVFSSPNGNESLTVSYYPYDLRTQGNVTVEQPGNVPYYSQPGAWQLTAAYLEDYAGNYTSYTQAQLATLFSSPYINVVNNGQIDITPPTVQSGQILTPKVSLSSALPVFSATLTGKDDVSGLYAPYVGIEPPGGSFSYVDNALMPFPLLSGTGTAYSTVYQGAPTGTWTISFYAFCDVAGNCFSDNSPTDVQNLFGTTTFKVTK